MCKPSPRARTVQNPHPSYRIWHRMQFVDKTKVASVSLHHHVRFFKKNNRVHCNLLYSFNPKQNRVHFTQFTKQFAHQRQVTSMLLYLVSFWKLSMSSSVVPVASDPSRHFFQ